MPRAGLIYGFHAIASRIRQSADSVLELYIDAGRTDARARTLADTAGQRKVRVILIEAERLDRMTGGASHQGVVARVELRGASNSIEEVLQDLHEPALLLLLDGVQDPHNLGACLRVADAMGVHAVIAPKDKSVGLTPTVAKVACGAADTVPYLAVTNLARAMGELKERGIWLIGADGGADSVLAQNDCRGATGFVLGAEGGGLRRLTRENCDRLVSIPMLGSVSSLNLSVAAGICLYEARRQRGVQDLKLSKTSQT
jgi:23S rRNA (guanosine2251-2'-O)-methyltransferase